MLLSVFKISGHSMMPKLNPDDRVLVSSIPYWFTSPNIGDIVVFKLDNKFLIKKIEQIEKGKYLVVGENKSDSLKIPRINRKEILGKLIFKLPKL